MDAKHDDSAGLCSAEIKQDLGFLLQQAHEALIAAAAAALQESACSVRAYYVLLVAREARLNQLEIGRILGIDRTVMVRVVDELEGLGLIARVPAPNDRRARILTLTEAGLGRLDAIRTGIRVAESQLLQGLEAPQRQHLRDALLHLASQRCTQGPKPQAALALEGEPTE